MGLCTTLQVKATPKFMHLARRLMTSESLQELIDVLFISPEKGVVIKGAGGIRKLRWKSGKDNRGKSGGLRILYYYEKQTVVLLITLFKKTDKANISVIEMQQIRKKLVQLLEENKNVETWSGVN